MAAGRLWGGWAIVGTAALACANPTATVVILQNQKASPDKDTGMCVTTTDLGNPRLAGVFDVNLDRDYPYVVYPLVQSRLPSLITSGGVERNTITLRAVRVQIEPPPGVNPNWQAGCPGTFDWPASAVLDPDASRALEAEGFQPCHARHLRELIQARQIPSDLAQPVFFTLKLSAIAERNGSALASDPFPFEVRVCAGCLQAQFPSTPSCNDTPKPNPSPGNVCNIAQDGPQVLCCLDDKGALVCPAPDA